MLKGGLLYVDHLLKANVPDNPQAERRWGEHMAEFVVVSKVEELGHKVHFGQTGFSPSVEIEINNTIWNRGIHLYSIQLNEDGIN